MSEKKLYVTTAYKYGNRNKHNYVVGIFEDFESAYAAAEKEEQERAGKYSCVVRETLLNSIEFENALVVSTPLDKKYIEKTIDLLKHTDEELKSYEYLLNYLNELDNMLSTINVRVPDDISDFQKQSLFIKRSKIISGLKTYLEAEKSATEAKKRFRRYYLAQENNPS